MTNCEAARLKRQLEEEEEDRNRQMHEDKKQTKKRELLAEIEQLKKEVN